MLTFLIKIYIFKLREKMTIQFGLIGSLVMLALFFCGLLLANKVTSFGASPASLALVTVITYLVSLIPTIGGVVGIIVQYIMLKKVNPEGSALLTMIVSVITTFLVIAAFFQVSGDISWLL